MFYGHICKSSNKLYKKNKKNNKKLWENKSDSFSYLSLDLNLAGSKQRFFENIVAKNPTSDIESKSRMVFRSFTCDPGKPIFPGGPSEPFSEEKR